MAMNYIYCRITNDHMEFVAQKESDLEIMIKFDKLYSRKLSALQISI